MLAELLLGVDVGTGGVRAALLDPAGAIVDRQETGYAPGIIRLAGAEAEADAGGIWAALCATVAALTERLSGRGRIVALAVSAMAPDAIPVDGEGQALAPCLLWQDRRAEAEAELVRRRVGEQRVLALTANRIDPYYGLVKALWLKRHRGGAYAAAARILSLKDYLVARLTGVLATDLSHAPLAGIAFDIRRNRWDRELASEIGLDPGKLPEVMPSEARAGALKEEPARVLGLSPGVPVASGLIDSAAGYLTCGIVASGDGAMSLGTSWCWGIYHREERFVAGMNVTRAPWDPEGYLTNASQASSGAVLHWLCRLTASPGAGGGQEPACAEEEEAAFAALEREAQAVSPGSGGLLTLPHFAGERTPLWDPLARGVLFGLGLHHRRGHLYRSALEGSALAFLGHRLILEAAGMRMPAELAVTGGAGRSALARRVLADVLGLGIRYLGGPGGEIGAAWLAGKSAGLLQDYVPLRTRRAEAALQRPDLEAHRFYRRLYEQVYRELYPRLRELYPRLGPRRR